MRKRRCTRARLAALAVLAVLAIVTAAAQDTEQSTLVINEVELNPDGLDSGNEWIEILNPSEQPVDLTGWTVSYTYRGPGTFPLIEEATNLGPGERFVFVYPQLALRNAQATVIRLIDPAGLIVDETSPLTDTDDDDSTWQRFPDGGDPWFPDLWLFLPATGGRTND
jgi:hypothetical protein